MDVQDVTSHSSQTARNRRGNFTLGSFELIIDRNRAPGLRGALRFINGRVPHFRSVCEPGGGYCII